MLDITSLKQRVRKANKPKAPDPMSAIRRKFIQAWFRKWQGRNVPDPYVTAEIAWHFHRLHALGQDMRKTGKPVRAPEWQSVDQTVEVKSLFFSALGIQRPEDSELVTAAKPHPGAFDNAESFRNAYWAAESWSKFPFELEGVDRQRSAEEAFINFERQCAVANERLHDVFSKASVPENIRAALCRARNELAALFEGITLDDWMHRCTFSGGASFGLSRVNSAVQNKFHAAFAAKNGATATSGVLPLADCFQRYSGWSNPVTLVPGNLIEWVPKNAKTDRTIAIEPDWNMFLQRGLGREIRHRLQRRWGLLHQSAQDVQRRRAQQGSKDGSLATLDLRGASDCISLALCEELLPSNVLDWIRSTRSPLGFLPCGRRIPYAKVASMGNGWTFELETALFAALCRSVSHDVTVYGDDIIVPRERALIVIELLEYCGFTINTDKSFVVGPFRESCGGHYYEGVSVTPPYFKKPLVGPARISAANSLRECATAECLEADGVFLPTWECLTRGVPSKFFGPSCMGSAVFHVPSDELSRRTFYNRQHQQVYWKGTGIRLVAPSVDAPGAGAAFAWLYASRGSNTPLFCDHIRWLRDGRPLSGVLRHRLKDILSADVEDSSYEQYAKDGFVPVLFDWKQPTWQVNNARPWSA